MRLRLALLPLSCLCLAVSFPLIWGNVAAQGNPSIVGRWSPFPNLPFFPVHTHLLPGGKVAIWPGDGGVSGNDMHSWDPANGAIVKLSQPGYDVFCTGHVYLADGRLIVVGGHIQNGIGLPYASTYDALNNLWTSVPSMNAGRWYPTATVLGNGDVLVVSGSIDNNLGENTLPQVYQIQSNSWRNLTSAQLSMDLYPRMHLAPDGRVFNSAPSTTSRSLNTSGTGGWSVIANHVVNVHRSYGSSVMYGAGKILVAGGADPPSATAEVIDLTAPIPAWRQVASMAFARRQQNAQVLPDGKVLVTGGTSGPGFNNPDTPVFASEMWDPDAETWTTMASAQVPRLYHSTLVLLPDGRLLSAGGNGYTQPELFEPPYLFAGARPTIAAAPASVAHQQTFFVNTPNAAAVTRVTLISLPSVTHAFDQNQRFNRLSFTSVAGGLNVVAPSANLAPPGPYMLFIVNSAGVPSVAAMVRITAATAGPTLTSLSPNSAAVNGPAFTLTVNGQGFVSGSVVRWNGTARTTTFVSASSLTAAIPASDLTTAGSRQITVLNPGGATSNALSFPVNAFTVSPATVARGGTVTATWSGLASPAATDRIGLYTPGAGNSAFLAWMYVSCSQTPGSPRASGSCPFTVPGSAQPGGYELRIVRDQTFTLLLRSNIFTIGILPTTTLSVNPTSIPSGGTLTATFSGVPGPSAFDWIGLYSPGSDNYSHLGWIFASSCSQTPGSPRASGSCPFTMPGTLAPGNYELRLIDGDMYDDLATSSVFSVAASPGSLQFSAATYNVAENGGSATITITRTGGSAGAVGVTLTTSNGTATSTADYTSVSQTVSFAAGDTANKTVSIPIVDDQLIEGNETVNVTVSAPTGGATLGTPSTAVLTITDNDAPPPGTLQLSVATYNVAENAGSATITVTRTGGSAGAVGVTLATSNGTAITPADYTAVSQTVSFAAGDTANKTVTIPITNNTVSEPSETVNLTLSAPTGGATLGSPASAVLTIADDDAPTGPVVTVSPSTIAQGGSGTATWSGISTPSSTDWIALYPQGAGNNSYIDWMYVSCSKTPGSAAASGSCPFGIAAALATGAYEVRLLSNNQFVVLAASNVFTVTTPAGPPLTVTPTTIVAGGSVTATWGTIANATSTDWIALFPAGAGNNFYIDWMYVSCSRTPGSAVPSGSCPVVIPSGAAPGTYELRLFRNNQFVVLATSNAFSVQSP